MSHDLRFSLRTLARHPAFTLVAVTTLALGIGANAAVFSVIDAVLLRPLPYPEPDRIFRMTEVPFRFTPSGMLLGRVVEQAPEFAGIGLYADGGLNLGGEPAERVRAAAVSPGFFAALGAAPTVGRTFTADDMTASAQVVVISHRLWARRFNSDRSIPGRTVLLNGKPFVVTGVLPPRVDFPNASEVWIPSGSDRQITGRAFAPAVIVRLAPGITPEHGRATMDRLNDRISAGNPDRKSPPATLTPLRDILTGGVRPIVLLVGAAVVLVLLVACINAANLLLARVASREREFAVRRALGASRGRLMRQVVSESLVLASLAGLAAIPAASVALQAVRVLVPPTMHGVTEIAMNARAVAATGALSVLTALLFGLAPSFSIRGRATADVLRGASSSTADPFWRRVRGGLVVLEVAIALVLLIGAVTIVRTVNALMSVDLGARGERALAAEITLPTAKYTQSWQILQFYDRLEGSLRAVPGVQEIGATTYMPGTREVGVGRRIEVESTPVAETESRPTASHILATPGYFRAIGIDLVAGRSFEMTDIADSPAVALVNERLARAVDLDAAAILGHRLQLGFGGKQSWAVIVGVVRDVRLGGPERNASPQIYVPYAQSPSSGTLYLVVKTGTDPRTAVGPVRSAVAAIDPDLPLYNVRTFDEIRATYLSDRRFAMTMMLVFGGLAFALATIGLYGVVSYLVQLRAREIGIRMALGASAGVVHRQVLRSGLTLAAAGTAAGVAGGILLSRVLKALVPGVQGVDALSAVTLGVVILLVAGAATWVPARRATRVDPLIALRAE